MSNPYSPTIATSKSPQAHPTRSPLWVIRMTTVFSCLAMIACLVLAAVLIPQAIRLTDEAQLFPPEFQGSNDSAIRGSWVLGVTSLVLAALNFQGVVWSFRKRVFASWALIGFSIGLTIVLAILFKPV